MGDDKRGSVRPRSYRGTRPRFASGTLMSRSDDTAPPRTLGYPRWRAVFSGCALRVSHGRSPQRSKERAERPGDGCPCVGAEEICGAPPLNSRGGTRTNAAPHAQNMLKREMLLPYLQDTEGSFSIVGGLLSNAEVGQQERVIPRDLTPTHWSMQIPSARGTKSACGRVYAVGVSTAYSVTPRLLMRNA